jgi:hypothetical protein
MLNRLLNWNARRRRINFLRSQIKEIEEAMYFNCKYGSSTYLALHLNAIKHLKSQITELGGRLP